ncbi:MAG: thioesterase [Deltaproteobacteria bacterium RIFOXYD12_FULL_50_9]|nr:MAG: thioesterase [Deltaproteobacteria bacterium RIFOXYD12_FULL_50_9]
MGFPRRYFEENHNGPLSLVVNTERRVRFEEVDMLGIVWHGRYVSYFEDGRVAFGDRYGLSYNLYREMGIAAPIVQMHVDYHAPLHFDEIMTITTTLHWCESLRLNFEYRITRGDVLAVRGYTVQLLTDLAGRMIIVPPEMVQAFRRAWQEGSIR